MKIKVIKKGILTVFAGLLIFNVNAQDGEALFKQNCAACHRLDGKRMVGPGLQGVKEKRSEEWLLKWIRNSQEMINAGDPDAIAIYEEYNKMIMTPFTQLSDDEIKAILSIIPGEGGNQTAEAAPAKEGATTEEAAPAEEVAYTEADIALGKALFEGSKRFENKGPACISCHNVTNEDVTPGGLLAKDLTQVYSRMGDAGVSGILSAPPFPAMANSYGSKPLTENEIHALNAFFKWADEQSANTQNADNGNGILIKGGIVGLIIILILIFVLWSNRKRKMTKEEIFSRQIKGKDSIVY
ncbi:MAG: hypothetical protein Kow0079_00600 [Vicingaceae bacterium]